jgi:hypothetical protein
LGPRAVAGAVQPQIRRGLAGVRPGKGAWILFGPVLGVEKRQEAVDGSIRRRPSRELLLRRAPAGEKKNGRRGELSGGLGSGLGGMCRNGRGALWSSTWPQMGHRGGPGSARTGAPSALNTWRLSLRSYDSSRGRGPDRGQQRRTRRGQRGQCGRAGAHVPGRDTRWRGLPGSSVRVSASGRRVASGDAASGSAAALGARAGDPDAKAGTARAGARDVTVRPVRG